MTLTPGSRLGVYEVTAQIGEGGMGQVFRATDTRLKRQVAIKILPPSVAADHDRLARFQREAEVLASLNHPHIAGVYGLEESGGVTALVMELIEGEDLSQRIARGRIPIDEALAIAKQIAEALEAAHEQGLIHRDLKPANIKVRADGTVKVLDFGLAKAVEPAGASSVSAMNSPTITSPAMTEMGVVLGTAAYMAPEQARGKAVDKRTDIWAFGVVLFEMLTGRQPFPGDDISHVLARVIERDPDWTALPPTTPPLVVRLLRRCLEKDVRRRLRDIGDALLELTEADEDDAAAIAPSIRPRHLALASLASILAGVGIGAMFGWLWFSRDGAPAPLTVGRFSIPLSSESALTNLDQLSVAISPDAQRIVYVAGDATPQLFVRELDSRAAKAIAGTEGAASPFFAPDGQAVAFFANSAIKKLDISEGNVSTISVAGAGNPRGGSWSRDGMIAYTPAPGTAVFSTSAEGRSPQPLTKLDDDRDEGAHHWPELLPNGNGILYVVGTSRAASWDERDIVAESLVTHERHIVAHGSGARYVPTGHVVIARGGSLFALPFDSDRLEATGTAIRIADTVTQSASGAAQFSVASNGTLIYVAGGTRSRELVWVSRTGVITPVGAPPFTYWSVRISPDGRRLALGVEAASYGVWVYDLVRGTMTRPSLKGTSAYPIWTPDGSRLTFNSTQSGGVLNLFWRPVYGSGDDERLAAGDAIQIANSWSPDGQVLVYQQQGTDTGRDVWLLARDRPAEPRPILRHRFNEGGAVFSPDGRWLAYVSDESGQANVYVSSYPDLAEKIPVSANGGGGPVWSRNGRELFFRANDAMMVADILPGTPLRIGKPRELFRGPFVGTPYQADYDVTADGQRFVMFRPSGDQSRPTSIEIVIGGLWRGQTTDGKSPSVR